MTKIKILFLSANPQDTQKLAVDEEIREISYKIRLSEGRDNLDLISAWAVRPDDLLQYLNQYRPHIVHFSGHGSTNGELMLVDHNSQVKPISAITLQTLFDAFQDSVQIVFLNACYSEIQGMAISKVIDYVVGMKSAVTDKGAIVFSAAFYRALGFKRTVEESFEQAKTALLLENISEEDTPELLIKESVLFKGTILFKPIATDIEQIKQLRKVFDRPAFKVSYIDELAKNELPNAIDDIQMALNTGRLYSRSGRLLAEVPDKSQFTSSEFRQALNRIANLLIQLKHIAVAIEKWIVESLDAVPPEIDWDLVIRKADLIDELRNQILHDFNDLILQAGQDSLPLIIPSSILYESDWIIADGSKSTGNRDYRGWLGHYFIS